MKLSKSDIQIIKRAFRAMPANGIVGIQDYVLVHDGYVHAAGVQFMYRHKVKCDGTMAIHKDILKIAHLGVDITITPKGKASWLGGSMTLPVVDAKDYPETDMKITKQPAGDIQPHDLTGPIKEISKLTKRALEGDFDRFYAVWVSGSTITAGQQIAFAVIERDEAIVNDGWRAISINAIPVLDDLVCSKYGIGESSKGMYLGAADGSWDLVVIPTEQVFPQMKDKMDQIVDMVTEYYTLQITSPIIETIKTVMSIQPMSDAIDIRFEDVMMYVKGESMTGTILELSINVGTAGPEHKRFNGKTLLNLLEVIGDGAELRLPMAEKEPAVVINGKRVGAIAPIFAE